MDCIEIKGYKSIKSAVIALKPINILIGANGAGKSNFVSFFELLNRIYEQKLKEYVSLNGGVDKFLHKGSKITEKIFAKLKFGFNAYSFEIKSGQDEFIFTSEGLWYDKNPYYKNPINISDFDRESKVKFYSMARAQYIRNYLQGLKKYHFHDTSKDSPFTKMSHCETDCEFLYERGENLAAFLFHIKNTNNIVYQRIIKTIQSIAPYFSDFYLHPNQDGFLRLLWQDKYSNTLYGARDLSDGTLRFIALTTLFLQPNLPQCIIIDEPELGLHPQAIAKLAGMVKSVASKSTQVIMATQSIDLINYFQAEDIITTDQIAGETHFKRLDSKELEVWLEEYTIGDLWQRNIITNAQPQ